MIINLIDGHIWTSVIMLLALSSYLAVLVGSYYKFDRSRIRFQQVEAKAEAAIEAAQAEAEAVTAPLRVRARTWVFELAKLPVLDETSRGTNLVELAITPFNVSFSAPIRIELRQSNLFRAREPGTSPQTVFPEAEVDATGQITDYGPVAVLYGDPFPMLKLWRDETSPVEPPESPYLWQVPKQYRP